MSRSRRGGSVTDRMRLRVGAAAAVLWQSCSRAVHRASGQCDAGFHVALVLLMGFHLVSSQPDPVLGRAGYALDFVAEQDAQWLVGGPMISISSETCTDLTGCVCCEQGKTGCCTAESELFKLSAAFSLEAWVFYRGIGHESATSHVLGNLHYSPPGSGSGLCTSVFPLTEAGCQNNALPLRGCSAECPGVTSGGFALVSVHITT